MPYEPLHHKYRPQTFADLVGQEAIATTLTNAILSQKVAPAYLFNGPRGTGKTSSARILAKSLNCLKSDKPTAKPCGVCDVCQGIAKGSTLDVIEIDAASNTGVDNIRELIERSQFAPVQCRYKVYVIDECHMLSTAAFNALLKTLEEPPRSVVFILATTDPQRVLPTIISRCQRFDFRRIPLEAMVKHLAQIAAAENINITPEAVHLVATCAAGGLRDAESLLDQLSLLSGQVTIERVWDLVGNVAEPDLLELLQAIASSQPEALLDAARRIMDRGREPLTLLHNLTSFYRDLLIAKTAPGRSDLVTVTSLTWRSLCEQAKTWDISSILVGQQHLAKSEVQIKNTTQPRLWLEVTLLGLLSAASSIPTQQDRQLQNINGNLSTNQFQPQPKIDLENISQPQPATPKATSAAEIVPAPVESEVPTIVQQDEPEHTPISSSTDEEVEVSPISEVVIDSSSVDFSVQEVWQQILAHLQPMSTRAMLRQMGNLLEFDGAVARIGMKSQSWCNQAKAYLPNIKAAFQATFEQEVQIKLELATIIPAKSTSVHESSIAGKVSISVASPAIKPTSSMTAITASEPVQAIAQRQSETIVGASTTSKLLPKTDAVSNFTPLATEWDDDESSIAAQRLADFFNGEIVRLKDEPFTQPTATASIPSPTEYVGYDTTAEEETDLDF